MAIIYDTDKPFVKYFDEIVKLGPAVLNKFFTHIVAVDGINIKTAAGYYKDVIRFFRFILPQRGITEPFEEIDESTEYDEIVSYYSDLITEDVCRTITRDEAHLYLYDLHKKGVAPSTRNRYLASLKRFFGYLDTVLGILNSNPFLYINTAKTEKKMPVFLTRDEAEKLLRSVPKDTSSAEHQYERNYCIISFFLNLGLRISELANINLQDINSDYLLSVYGKGSKERRLSLPSACISALNAYLEVRNNIYKIEPEAKNALFISKKGFRLSVRSINRVVHSCIRHAGLDDRRYTPHKLRHTAATLMYRGCDDIVAVKEALGHTQLNTTSIYVHADSRMVENAIQGNPLSGIVNENQKTTEDTDETV